jgi:hypothetical protein
MAVGDAQVGAAGAADAAEDGVAHVLHRREDDGTTGEAGAELEGGERHDGGG